ncbi:MAG TPA: hypothetical protein VFK65_20720 [Candidatus Binatia bacterium]|jgi:hypothetical protein|nr:hypothetical protein [Candidatus Binatia bacterium]
MVNLHRLTQITLLLLISLSEPAAAQTLLRGATPGALTGADKFFDLWLIQELKSEAH